MIVVEGPDGSGKSTLVEKISYQLGIPVHERASDSIKGPVHDLMNWAYTDVTTQPEQPLAVYDRHPLISEYIYAPLVRTLRPEFTTAHAHTLIRLMARQVFVVWCMPPHSDVEHNTLTSRDNQMAGVNENSSAIYGLYNTLRMFWPGQSATYDYTEHSHHADTLMPRLRLHSSAWRMKNHQETI